MAIPEWQRANFQQLVRAAKNDALALVECTSAKTGKKVNVVCAVSRSGEEYQITPFAKMFSGNPYNEVIPPTP